MNNAEKLLIEILTYPLPHELSDLYALYNLILIILGE
jgi:hypothetical protein